MCECVCVSLFFVVVAVIDVEQNSWSGSLSTPETKKTIRRRVNWLAATTQLVKLPVQLV